MCNVISLCDKLETWKTSYEKDDFYVSVSSHGKFCFFIDGKKKQLTFMESVRFLKELSESMEEAMNPILDFTKKG